MSITLDGTSGVTSSNATLSGSLVLANTVISAVTGTGSMVLGTNPTISGNLTTSSLVLANTVINSVTGTGSIALSTAPTFTGSATFSGNSSSLAAILAAAGESINVTSTAATGTINYDVTSQNVLYFTANATANWTVNFRGSSGTTLNNTMAVGQAVTAAHLVTQGATAYYNSLVQVDGANTTAKWQGGTAPTAGNASSVDGYIYTIVKTANTTFSVFAGLTQYK